MRQDSPIPPICEGGAGNKRRLYAVITSKKGDMGNGFFRFIGADESGI